MAKAVVPGVVVDGRVVRIDLAVHSQLTEANGVLELPTLGLLVVRGKKRFRAFCSFCPHKPKKKRVVERTARTGRRPEWICSAHRWTFDHKGRPTGKAEEGLDRYRVEVDGRELRIYR